MLNTTDRLITDSTALRAMLAELFRPYDLRGYQLEACAIWPDKEAKRAPLAMHFTAEEIDTAASWLAERNADGWGIYVGAGLRRDAPRRGRANKGHVMQTRWLWADFDAEGAAATARAKLEDVGFQPSFWVCTGRVPFERWHAWWALEEAVSGPDAEGMLRRLVPALGADKAPTSRSGVMRLVGGVAWPKPDKPGRVAEMVTRHDGSGRAYGAAEVAAVLDVLDPPKPKPQRRPARGRAAVASRATSAQIEELLRWIDPAPLHYDDWLRVGMALHDAGEPLDTWESWSARSPKHDDSDMQRRWESFGRTSAGVTLGTLYHMAAQAGADLGAIARMATPEARQRPADGAEGLPVAEARARLEAVVRGFWGRWKARHPGESWRQGAGAMLAAAQAKAEARQLPRVELVNASLGLGKTDATLRMVAEAIRERRAAGDADSVVTICTPMHKLSDQMAADFERIAPDLKAAVLRGPEANDPDRPGESVCKRLDKYREARARLLDPEQEICRTCPHRAGCRVLTDKLVKADVYITAHAALAGKAPHERAGPPGWWVAEHLATAGRRAEAREAAQAALAVLAEERKRALAGLSGAERKAVVADFKRRREEVLARRSAALVKVKAEQAEGRRPREGQRLLFTVIDEDPMSSVMFGTDMPRDMSIDAWKRAPDGGEEELRHARAWLAAAVERNGEGHLRRESFMPKAAGELAGLGAVVGVLRAEAAAKLEWARKAGKGDGAEGLDQNRTVRITAAVWRELASFLRSGAETCGRLEAVVTGDKGLCLRHVGLRPVADGWRGGGMLMLDATGRRAVAEVIIGEPVAVHEVKAAQPMLRVVQDTTRSFGKSMFQGFTESGAAAARANVKRLHGWVTAKAAALAPERLGLVTYKAVVEQLEELGMPDNVTVANFGALRGMNDMQDVAGLAVVGRPMPEEHGLGRMAAALTGQPVAGRYQLAGEAERLVRAADGLWWRQDAAARHEDDAAQMMLEAVRDSEVVQALGRPRAVNRAEPVTVWLLSDAVVPVPVELAEVWDGIGAGERDPIARMLAAGGIAFTSGAAASAAYPQLWGTARGANMALARAGSDAPPPEPTREQTSYNTLYMRSVPESARLGRVEYRVPRAPAPAVAIVDLVQHPDPVAAVQRALPAARDVVVLDTPAPAQEAAPPPAQAAPVAHIQRPKRPRHRMEPWPLPPGKCQNEALAEMRAGLPAFKRWLEEAKVAAAPP